MDGIEKMTPAEIESRITAAMPCDFIEIQSEDNVHYYGIVVSAQYEGLSRVRQHQAVYATLGDQMGREIHALQLQTYTPAQWQAFLEQQR